MKFFRWLLPKRMAGQMIAVLAFSLTLLLTVLTLQEISDHDSALQWANRTSTLDRLRRMKPMLEGIQPDQVANFLEITSLCHEGYTVTKNPFRDLEPSAETDMLLMRIADELVLATNDIQVGRTLLTRDDFSYHKCNHSEIDLPMQAIVISIALNTGYWFHTEVHPHEWHVQDLIDWVVRASGAFIFIGGFAIFFMHRLSKPLDHLTAAAQRFGSGLEVSPVVESGPLDLRRAIQSFNAMQRQVSDEVSQRTHTLAAISHDLRTPITALRVKAELIDDGLVREDLIASITKLERLTASALAFLRGESRSEPLRNADLSALIETECQEFSELGQPAVFEGVWAVHYHCRPDAMGRAVRNLIENAIKYGNGALVNLKKDGAWLTITVSDRGPGIPNHQKAQAMEPFGRLSKARESEQGGFGLGLSLVEAIAKGHDGALILEDNQPSGLSAIIRLPIR